MDDPSDALGSPMKAGDLVKYIPYADKQHGYGVVVRINDFSRQTTADVLFHFGVRGQIWVKHLELIDEV